MVRKEIRGMRISLWQIIVIIIVGVLLFVDIPSKIKEIKEGLKELKK